MPEQLSLFTVTVDARNGDAEVQAILSGRRLHSASGQTGEDVQLIRNAILAARGREASDA